MIDYNEYRFLREKTAEKIMGWKLVAWQMPYKERDGKQASQRVWTDIDGCIVCNYIEWNPYVDIDFDKLLAKMDDALIIRTSATRNTAWASISVADAEPVGDAGVDVENGQVAQAMRTAILKAMLEAVDEEGNGGNNGSA